MNELLQLLVKSIVDTPEEVTISEVVGEKAVVYEIKVAESDIGKVIGKQGRTAKAMRTILSAASTKLRKRTVLEIIE